MRAGRCWVKLTGPYRISAGGIPYSDVTPFAHALIDAAPQRVIWGTDWPHVMVKSAMPNDGALCDLLLTGCRTKPSAARCWWTIRRNSMTSVESWGWEVDSTPH